VIGLAAGPGCSVARGSLGEVGSSPLRRPAVLLEVFG